MSIAREITTLQQSRNAVLDGMEALSAKAAADARLFTDEEQSRWARDEAEVASIDRQSALLRNKEQQAAAMARPAESPLGSSLAMPERSGGKSFPGQGFTRFCCALAISKGNLPAAVEYAQRWGDQPQIESVLRAATKLGGTADPFWLGRAPTSPGTSTDPVWAAPLVNYQIMQDEFIALLRPKTLLGRLTGLRQVPFNVKIPRQTAGASAGWVGEGASKPISSLAFDMITIPWAKIAVIVVITQELARFSSPSAEMLVRDDLLASIAQFMDQQFIDPSITPVAGIRPGSITNGVTPIPSTGSTVAAVTNDLTQALLAMTTALAGNIASPAWLMNPTAAMTIATLRTAQDIFAFPGMGTMGAVGLQPNLLGVPVIVSSNIPVAAGKSSIVLLDQNEILVADDGAVLIDTSAEASVQMDTAPATPPTPLVSFWQQNLLGIKGERYIFWLRRHNGGVQVVSNFPGP
jgi:HK97 family phage major capsid protein